METSLYLAAAVAAVAAAVAVLARRLRQSPPIFLVLAGVLIALTPGAPAVAMRPDLVMLLFLPPVLYYAAFAMSWQAFRANLRPIALLAVGAVLFTSGAVAAAAHYGLGLSWPLGFLLGALVSPPDVVAPLAIARRLGAPKRLVDILEGEGLVNDATALVLFTFAVQAVTTGQFSIREAGGVFAADLIGETLWGLLAGWTILGLRRLAKEPRAEVTLSLLTPYVAFWAPHALGGSGVLACVVSGLYVGVAGTRLIPSGTRLQALFFWDFLTYLLEGGLFLLTGLQARIVVERLNGGGWPALVAYGVGLSLLVIVVRYLWVFPATYLPRLLWPGLRRRDPAPPWQYSFALASTGVRGVVSLAAALSVPIMLPSGAPFPGRDLILFLTYSVIVCTLVGQGLALPWLIRRLGLADHGRRERARNLERELQARTEMARAALGVLETTCRAHQLEPELVAPLKARHQARVRHLEGERIGDLDAVRGSRRVQDVEIELIEAQRGRLNDLVGEGAIDDEIRRRIERDLDLEEQQLRNAPHEEALTEKGAAARSRAARRPRVRRARYEA
jgi:CPA1 family monovalent cation:H+ antiporter